MSRCATPVRRHSSSAVACPACRSRSSSRSYCSYANSGGGCGGSKSSGGSRPRWSKARSSVSYTFAQVHSLNPIRETVESGAAAQPDLRDVFLCHACDDRQGSAKELHELLVAAGVTVWYCKKDVGHGVPLMRAINKGLANSRIGLVLLNPALLARLPKESVADKELSALLPGNLLVPIVHNTAYDAHRNVSPFQPLTGLPKRSGYFRRINGSGREKNRQFSLALII